MKKKDNPTNNLIKQEGNTLPTNAEVKKIIDKILVRLENWKMEAVKNPNPRLIHSLKNIISLIDSVTSIAKTKIKYSYKMLSRQMSILIDSVAKLNIIISDSLMEDDYIDKGEEKAINDALMTMVRAAVDLIAIVQQSFSVKSQIKG